MKKKNKKLIYYSVGVLFIVGIIALIAVSRGNNTTPQAAYSAGVLTALEDRFDFDTISMEEGDVSHQYEITNNSKEEVAIEKVYTSCMCTTALIVDSEGEKYGKFGMPGHDGISRTNIKVGPGESVFVEAIFDPAAHGPSGVGLAQRSIYLETNSATSPKVELRFQAMVTR